jgi:hypothetical protein
MIITDVDSILVLLHHEAVGNVANVSEVHASSIIRVKCCRLVSFCVYVAFCSLKNNRKIGGGDRVVIGALSGPVGRVDWEHCADGPFMGQEVYQNPISM